MKLIRTILLLVATMGVIDSCTKTETKTSAAETNGALLAGAVGSSKSWTITSISQSINGGAAQTVTPGSSGNSIPTCESDNVYKFSNNPAQGYDYTEGTAVCTTGDPTSIESGTWAFTDDGKTLLIEGTTNVTTTELQSTNHYLLGYLILTQSGPLSVTQISATSVTMTYSFVYNSSNYLITVVLGKV